MLTVREHRARNAFHLAVTIQHLALSIVIMYNTVFEEESIYRYNLWFSRFVQISYPPSIYFIYRYLIQSGEWRPSLPLQIFFDILHSVRADTVRIHVVQWRATIRRLC